MSCPGVPTIEVCVETARLTDVIRKHTLGHPLVDLSDIPERHREAAEAVTKMIHSLA
jgi:hypothetical protein